MRFRNAHRVEPPTEAHTGPRLPLRVLPLVGLALSAAAANSAAAGARPAPRPTAPVLPPPWACSDGPAADDAGPFADEGFEAPAIPAGETRLGPPPWRDRPRAEEHAAREQVVSGRREPAGVHPAIHRERRRPEQRLFPRAARRYTVRHGDTLWDIAAAVLGTDDPRRIARYWPRVHRANRDLIGPDPARIFPGQRLVLPAE